MDFGLRLCEAVYLLYSALLTTGLLALSPRFLYAAWRHGKYIEGLGERLGRAPAPPPHAGPVIWLHCVSVGEVMAARPLVRALAGKVAPPALFISTTTVTGQRVAREIFGSTATAIFYYPIDLQLIVTRALDRVRPSLLLLMETELWPRMIRECRRRGIPVCIVNGRISPASFSRYRIIRRFLRRVLANLSLSLMQSQSDAERLLALGAAEARVRTTGNLKFDAPSSSPEREVALAAPLKERFEFDEKRPLIIAASTHHPEEKIIVAAYQRLVETGAGGPRPRLLLVPRHPERFDETALLLERTGFLWVRRSAPSSAIDASADIILLDSIGELGSLYALAEIVFVGGSLAVKGGHNILEPAAVARPIIIGPHTFNFTGIVRIFREAQALVEITPADEAGAITQLSRAFAELLHDPDRRHTLGQRARALLDEHRGATARTLELLAPFLPSSSRETALT